VLSGCVNPEGAGAGFVPCVAATGAVSVGVPDAVIVTALPLVKFTNWFVPGIPLPSVAKVEVVVPPVDPPVVVLPPDDVVLPPDDVPVVLPEDAEFPPAGVDVSVVLLPELAFPDELGAEFETMLVAGAPPPPPPPHAAKTNRLPATGSRANLLSVFITPEPLLF